MRAADGSLWSDTWFPLFHSPTCFSFLTNISRSVFLRWTTQINKTSTFLLCTIFCVACTTYMPAFPDEGSIEWGRTPRDEFIFQCLLNQLSGYFPVHSSLMWAALQPCFILFLFLISNRALVLPSEESLIEIYAHVSTPARLSSQYFRYDTFLGYSAYFASHRWRRFRHVPMTQRCRSCRRWKPALKVNSSELCFISN